MGREVYLAKWKVKFPISEERWDARGKNMPARPDSGVAEGTIGVTLTKELGRRAVKL